jgi:hypothetical protein
VEGLRLATHSLQSAISARSFRFQHAIREHASVERIRYFFAVDLLTREEMIAALGIRRLIHLPPTAGGFCESDSGETATPRRRFANWYRWLWLTANWSVWRRACWRTTVRFVWPRQPGFDAFAKRSSGSTLNAVLITRPLRRPVRPRADA